MQGKESTKVKTGGLITSMDSAGLPEQDTQMYAACPKCGNNFHSDPNKGHSDQQIVGKKIVHRCIHCDEYFSTSPDKNVSRGKTKCKKMGPGFYLKQLLKATTADKNIKSLYQCLFCNKTFDTLSERNVHLATHAGTDTHMCTLCGFLSHEKSAVESHMIAHKGGNVYKCPVCCSVFVSAAELDQHLTRHLGDTLHRCSQCHFVSTTKSAMQPQMMSLTLVQSEAQRHQETGVVTQDINIRITYSCLPKDDRETSLLDNNDMSDEGETYPLHQSGSPEPENRNSPLHLADFCASHAVKEEHGSLSYPSVDTPGLHSAKIIGETSQLNLPEASHHQEVNTNWPSSQLSQSHPPDSDVGDTEIDCFLLKLSSTLPRVKTEGESPLSGLSVAAKRPRVRTKSAVKKRESAVIHNADVAEDSETVGGIQDCETDSNIQHPDSDSADRGEGNFVMPLKVEDISSPGKMNKAKVVKDKLKGIKGKAKGINSKAKEIKDTEEEIHRCCFCSRTFESEQSLTLHESCHKKCALCRTRFSTPRELEEHIQGHIVGKEYRCLVCRQWSSDLLTHMANHPSDAIYLRRRQKVKDTQQDTGEKLSEEGTETKTVEGYECYICAKRYTCKSYLQVHLRTHDIETPYSCFLCGMLFREFIQLSKHMQLHGSKRFQCDECGKQYAHKHSLKNHVAQEHTEERPHQCTLCGKMFATISFLQAHVEYHHSDPESLKCPQCPKVLKNIVSFRAHIKMHGDMYHTCAHCGRKMYSACKLRDHERRMHTGEKPFPCSMCSKQFVTKAQAKTHMMVHSGVKPHMCSVGCGKTFKTLKQLKDHMKIHNEKSNKCSVCGKAFHQARYLKIHMMNHTGEKPFLCAECGRSFKTKSSMEKHTHLTKRPGRKKRKTNSEGWTETTVAVPVMAGGGSETEVPASSINEPLIEVQMGEVPEAYSFMTVELVSDIE